ncbi:MAG: carbohydrate kinase family protein [Pseudomonadales bacterium]|nr:carbohydrate kinase family protein [Pseudomonadales bacterium]
MNYDIVTIGSATVDYFADTDSELIRIDTRTSHEELLAFPLGGKILINELNTTSGGGGTNTAVAFSRLGLHTAYLGKLGMDATGDFVLDALAAENISFIGKRAGKTGVSFVLNSIRDDRTILAYKGANNCLLPADVPAITAPWVYLSSMLEQSWQTVVDLVCTSTFKLAFNPSSYQAAMGYQQLRPLVDRVSILVMNREEACLFLGRDEHQDSDLPELVRALAQVPGQITAVTDGARGVWVYDGKDHVHAASPRPDLKILETTGAGDAFAATFTAALIRGLPITSALDYGMSNAESVLQHKGAKEKLLHWEELLDISRSNPRNIVSSSALVLSH